MAVVIDGDDSEWEDNGSQVILESRDAVREMRALHDEGYLYLRLVVDEPELWVRETITIGFDVLAGGNGGLPGHPGLDPDADYTATLGPGDSGAVYVRASNDPFILLYGAGRGYVAVDPADLEEGSGVWNLQTLITNRPLVIPSTGEEQPGEILEVGLLLRGTSDPTDPACDSRAAWAAAEQVVELRLAYQAIGFADPSSLQAYRIGPTGGVGTEKVERIGVTVTVGGSVQETAGYAWEGWQVPTWHERLKAGIEDFATAVEATLGK
jgi:hypothetical protein